MGSVPDPTSTIRGCQLSVAGVGPLQRHTEGWLVDTNFTSTIVRHLEIFSSCRKVLMIQL